MVVIVCAYNFMVVIECVCNLMVVIECAWNCMVVIESACNLFVVTECACNIMVVIAKWKSLASKTKTNKNATLSFNRHTSLYWRSVEERKPTQHNTVVFSAEKDETKYLCL